MLLSLYDRPEFVREIVDHFAELICICAEKALREATVDMVLFYDDPVGSKGPMVGPETMREFFLGATARLADLSRSCGVDTVMLRPRGDIRALLDGYVAAGVTGLGGIEDHANVHLADMLERYGERLCFVGGIDCRTLLGSFADIEREVEYKVRLARGGRVVPCLSAMVYPEVEYPNYAHYMNCLRRAIVG
jgi:uroporphyrinogen decarboxylase